MPDTSLICLDCGAAFLFTEAEQLLFQQRGFAHLPKRCRDCRARQRQSGRGSAGRGARAMHGGPRSPDGRRDEAAPAQTATVAAPHLAGHDGAAEPSRPPRPPRGPMHATNCSICGVATEVPFRPDGVRPVFCLPCLKRQTR